MLTYLAEGCRGRPRSLSARPVSPDWPVSQHDQMSKDVALREYWGVGRACSQSSPSALRVVVDSEVTHDGWVSCPSEACQFDQLKPHLRIREGMKVSG